MPTIGSWCGAAADSSRIQLLHSVFIEGGPRNTPLFNYISSVRSMKLLRAGVDSIYIAIHGQLSAWAMEKIAGAKETAVRERRGVLVQIGPASVPIEVHPHGS